MKKAGVWCFTCLNTKTILSSLFLVVWQPLECKSAIPVRSKFLEISERDTF